MIDREEIEQKAEEFSILPANVQRDYVFGWVLAGIYGETALKDTLVLKGGACFRKGYFEHTRFTNDLDFATEGEIDPQLLETEIGKACEFAHAATGIEFETDRNNVRQKMEVDDEKRVFEARVYFKDFYGNPDTCTIKISMDVIEFDRMYLPVQSRYLIHPYSDVDSCRVEIQCQKLEELLANKLKCLLQRRHSHDLYDFVYSLFLNKDIDVSRAEIVSTLFKKTIYEGNPHAARDLLVGLPFEIFRGAWNKYLFCPIKGLLGFDDAVEQFKVLMSELFDGLPIRQSHLAFCPADIRNPIMEAGSAQKLMEVRYQGRTRTVEPYSLAYKRKQGGVAREYFYCWDRSGGNSGHVGIKSFFANEIQSASVMDEAFEPRYEIELSKAGEASKNAYFGSPFPSSPRSSRRQASGYRPVKSPLSNTRTRRPRAVGVYKPKSLKYVYQCGVCGKQFTRKTQSSKMNTHKDRYGNKCFGRTGYLVTTKYA